VALEHSTTQTRFDQPSSDYQSSNTSTNDYDVSIFDTLAEI
jgi:hypothetical protein